MVDTEETRQALTQQILSGLAVLVQGIRRNFPTTVDAMDITMRQCRALMVLAEAPASMSRLATAVGASLPSTTGLVDRLVQRGVVARREDPHDRRLVICELTAAGRDVIEAFMQADREVFTQLLTGLTAGELAAVQDAVSILRRQVELQAGTAVAATASA